METFAQLVAAGAVIQNSHVVYPTGQHGSTFIHVDALFPEVGYTSQIAQNIAEAFQKDDVDVVVGSGTVGAVLAQWVAYHLSMRAHRKARAVYATPKERVILSMNAQRWRRSKQKISVGENEDSIGTLLDPGDEVIVRRARFAIVPAYLEMMPYRRTLVLEPVLYYGDRARYVVEAARAAKGRVVGVACICNAGGITRLHAGNPPKVYAYTGVTLDMYNEESCPLCKQGVPINAAVGHGKEYLDMKDRPR